MTDVLIGLIPLIILLAIMLIPIAGLWKVFQKAGEPGWAAIIPLYNTWIIVKITDNEVLWFILTLLPLVNFIAWIKLSLDLADSFGKGTGFAVGIIILPFIFIPLLGFGDARYQGRAGGGAGAGL
jgi:hypothetical protein